MATRPYDMQSRRAGKLATRERALSAAYGLLDAPAFGELSLEAVARAADVTRVTVYNHFGSRRQLLLALFAEVARRMQVERIRDAMRLPEPRAALRGVITQAARGWRNEERAVSRLFALSVLDAEVGREVARFERARRSSLRYLARRLAAGGALGRGLGPAEAAVLLGALTSFQAFAALSGSTGRPVAARLVLLCERALGLRGKTKRAAPIRARSISAAKGRHG